MNELLGYDREIDSVPASSVRIATSKSSILASEVIRKQLGQVSQMPFIFIPPSFGMEKVRSVCDCAIRVGATAKTEQPSVTFHVGPMNRPGLPPLVFNS